MTPAQRRREFRDAMKIDLPEQAADDAATVQTSPKPGAGGERPPERSSAIPTGPEPSPSAGAAPAEQTEIEALKRCDDEIAGMSRAHLRTEFQDAAPTEQSDTPNPASSRAPRISPTKNLSGKVIYGGLGLILLCTSFNVVFRQREAPPAIPGWDAISSCSFMVSFDGKRRLSLSENHFARIEEPDHASADGSWSFDGTTGKYIVTMRDEPVAYSVVAPGDRDNCMLIRGDLATADLHRSWFYSRADVDDQSDNEPPER